MSFMKKMRYTERGDGGGGRGGVSGRMNWIACYTRSHIYGGWWILDGGKRSTGWLTPQELVAVWWWVVGRSDENDFPSGLGVRGARFHFDDTLVTLFARLFACLLGMNLSGHFRELGVSIWVGVPSASIGVQMLDSGTSVLMACLTSCTYNLG